MLYMQTGKFGYISCTSNNGINIFYQFNHPNGLHTKMLFTMFGYIPAQVGSNGLTLDFLKQSLEFESCE